MYSVSNTAHVDVPFLYVHVHVYMHTNYLYFFAARSIAGYLHQYDQQIRNCD